MTDGDLRTGSRPHDPVEELMCEWNRDVGGWRLPGDEVLFPEARCQHRVVGSYDKAT